MVMQGGDDLVSRLERALARGSRLLALTQALQGALRPADVADVVTRAAGQALGTYFAGIAVVDPERRSLSYLSMHPLPAQTTTTWRVIPLQTPAPVAWVARTGQATFYESVEAAEQDFPGIAEHMVAAGTQAMAHLPLIAGDGRRLGVLALTFDSERALSPSTREFMSTVAGYTAQALERALLYEQKLTVAEALQGSVLPTQLPQLDGWQIVGRFHAGAIGTEVGGDWYDAFVVPSGCLVCVVGDATGHGLAAARVMSAVRNSLRAYAVISDGPADALTRLDRMLGQLEPETMATVLYLELDPVTGEGRLCQAGHPPPLLCRPDGAAYLAPEPDPPLGCLESLARHDHEVRLAPGEGLLLYTDGLVERRDEDLSHGLARLLATAEAATSEHAVRAEAIDLIVEKMIDSGSVGDDVCALLVRRDDHHVDRGRRHRSVDLAPLASSVSRARRLAHETLTTWGSARRRDDVVLVVSELVTNAIIHAGSALTLELELISGGDGDRVRVTVIDRSRHLPQRQQVEPDQIGGRGVLLVDLLADSWGSESAPSGKRVWAEFLLEPVCPARAFRSDVTRS